MCGIVAVWSADGGVAPADLAGAIEAIAHRGPDGRGLWSSPSGRAVLGHTRLAVIDLVTGDQPIGADGGALQVVTNGEFYGYVEIRHELMRRGRSLTTHGDSEIALHLFALDGLAALAQLRGEFAFVIWDERRGELVAVRDRFGIKPLYYAEFAGRLYLASEIKAILAAGVPARWDVDAFADHLQISLPADRTLFQGIRQVPPGCYLIANQAGIRIERYWDLDFPRVGERDVPARREEFVSRVAADLCDAVSVRTRADVPVGYHLSGGLDSSAVVAIGARHGRATTFTVRFDDDAYDESPVARATAAFLGMDHREVPYRRADFAAWIAATIRAGEMVQENSHGVARYLHSAAIRAHGVTVVLAGEGGDELFAGYPQFQKDLTLTQSAQARAHACAGYAKLDAMGAPVHLKGLLDALGLIPTWVLDRYVTVTSPIQALLRDEFAERLARRDASAALLASGAGQLGARSFLHQSLYLFMRSWLCNYILAAERLDMAHALEVRLPLLDHRLFETVRATPIDWYRVDGQTKFALRAAMRPHLPAQVCDGDKRGFFAPPALEDDRALAALRDLSGAEALRDNPFFAPDRVSALLDRLAASPSIERARSERLVQIIASTCVLGREFGMSTP